MNIFILDSHPTFAAQMQCDKHVVKMILESAQMLCTAHNVLDGYQKEGFYRTTHINHPCNVWIRNSYNNYCWLWLHLRALCKEYTYRYGKVHKCEASGLVDALKEPPKGLVGWRGTPFAVAMGNNPECIVEGDPVASYRNYYKTKKDKFKMIWTKRDVPDWFEEKLDKVTESL